MSAASSDSRHTISSVSNTPSPYQQRAAALLVEIVEELVPAGSESGDVDGRRLPRLDHALAVQLEALELDRCRGPIGHLETHAGTGRRLELLARELDDLPAALADDVVVLLLIVLHRLVARLPIVEVALGREPALLQQLEGAVHGRVSDTRIHAPHGCVELFHGQMPLGAE